MSAAERGGTKLNGMDPVPARTQIIWGSSKFSIPFPHAVLGVRGRPNVPHAPFFFTLEESSCADKTPYFFTVKLVLILTARAM